MAASVACPHCDGSPGDRWFCRSCGVLNAFPDAEVFQPSRRVRLRSMVREVTQFLRLYGVRWVGQQSRLADQSQTPGKAAADLYILTEAGRPASRSRIWYRTFVAAVLLPVFLVNVILIVRRRRTLHDRIAHTLVVQSESSVLHLRPQVVALRGTTKPGGDAPGLRAPSRRDMEEAED